MTNLLDLLCGAQRGGRTQNVGQICLFGTLFQSIGVLNKKFCDFRAIYIKIFNLPIEKSQKIG
jgi:hypothetical protein